MFFIFIYFVNTKNQLRKKILQQRRNLSEQARKNLSQAVCANIAQFKPFINSQTIALYHATAGEVDLQQLLDFDKSFYLPKIQAQNSMNFHRVDQQTKLVKNKYGIFEPNGTQSINANQIDLCLLPLLAFNRHGQRLGMGGGYYDRYFALNKMAKKPTILVGIAYDFQENATIPSEPWDIPLDFIITNDEIIKI